MNNNVVTCIGTSLSASLSLSVSVSSSSSSDTTTTTSGCSEIVSNCGAVYEGFIIIIIIVVVVNVVGSSSLVSIFIDSDENSSAERVRLQRCFVQVERVVVMVAGVRCIAYYVLYVFSSYNSVGMYVARSFDLILFLLMNVVFDFILFLFSFPVVG